MRHSRQSCPRLCYYHSFPVDYRGDIPAAALQSTCTLNEARDSEWQWHQLGHMQVCTSLKTDNHASTPSLSFLQVGCPSCRPTNSVKALKATRVSGSNYWAVGCSNNCIRVFNTEKQQQTINTTGKTTAYLNAVDRMGAVKIICHTWSSDYLTSTWPAACPQP